MRWVLAGLLLMACDGAAPKPPSVSVPQASAAISPAEPIVPAGPDCNLVARSLPASTPSAWGSVSPDVWLTRDSSVLRAWYPSGYQKVLRTAELRRDGTLGTAEEFSLFGSVDKAGYPAVASLGSTTVAVANVYVADENADIFVALRRGGKWGAPFAIKPDPELDNEPIVAMSSDRIAVAWSHGKYPQAPDMAVAVLDHGGKVLHHEIAARNVEAEGMSLVAVPKGWLLVYTPSSALQFSQRGLGVVRLDRDGRVLSNKNVLDGDALWPVASWNGREVGIAFRSGRKVGFVRASAEGELVEPKTEVADEHPDPLAGFRPLSLVAEKNGWWLADVAQFSASVMIARASEGRVVRLDAQGRPRGSVVVSDEQAGASLVRIVPWGPMVRGVLVEDRGKQLLRAFDVACGATQPAPQQTACDPREQKLGSDRFAALRMLVESNATIERDLAVGYRELSETAHGLSAGDDVHVSRMKPDGRSAWDVSLGPGFHPALAVGHGSIAALIKIGSGSTQVVAMLDSSDGKLRSRRELSGSWGDHCIAATGQGFLVVRGGSYDRSGRPGAIEIGKDGSPGSATTLDEPVNSCALWPVPNGFVLAYTHPGDVSETNYLFVRRLDEHGKARSAGRRIESVHFATAPYLTATKDGILLLFEDALGRELSGLALDASGTPRGKIQQVASTFGLRSFALWGDDIVWTTPQSLARRGCLDRLFKR